MSDDTNYKIKEEYEDQLFQIFGTGHRYKKQMIRKMIIDTQEEMNKRIDDLEKLLLSCPSHSCDRGKYDNCVFVDTDLIRTQFKKLKGEV